jgi:nucleoside-diphosphate-sugar epimerase
MDEGTGITHLPRGGSAIVIGAGGGIGAALLRSLEASGQFETVWGLGRHTTPALDLLD